MELLRQIVTTLFHLSPDSVNALAHSYAGLYAWALHHRLNGWQAVSWPAEIDVFLAVGELALYVAYLDGWPARQRIWPWTNTLVGLAEGRFAGKVMVVPRLSDGASAAPRPIGEA